MKRLTISTTPIYGVTDTYPGQVSLRLSCGIYPVVSIIQSMGDNDPIGHVTAWMTDGNDNRQDVLFQARMEPEQVMDALANILGPLDFSRSAMKVAA